MVLVNLHGYSTGRAIEELCQVTLKLFQAAFHFWMSLLTLRRAVVGLGQVPFRRFKREVCGMLLLEFALQLSETGIHLVDTMATLCSAASHASRAALLILASPARYLQEVVEFELPEEEQRRWQETQKQLEEEKNSVTQMLLFRKFTP